MLAADSGGKTGPVLLLVHGLGATRQVWTPLLDRAREAWPGLWINVDLPGHGRSPSLDDYAPPFQAAAVAELVRAQAPGAPVFALGHSLGGVVSLALADPRHGVDVQYVLALGVKVTWTAEEADGLAERAKAPVKIFKTAEEAVARHLKMAGLMGLVAPDDPIALSGIWEALPGWRTAMDPRAQSVGPPEMARLVDSAHATVRMARGATDGLCTLDQLQDWDPLAFDIADSGHNAMVEQPEAIWNWICAVKAEADAAPR